MANYLLVQLGCIWNQDFIVWVSESTYLIQNQNGLNCAKKIKFSYK